MDATVRPIDFYSDVVPFRQLLQWWRNGNCLSLCSKIPNNVRIMLSFGDYTEQGGCLMIFWCSSIQDLLFFALWADVSSSCNMPNVWKQYATHCKNLIIENVKIYCKETSETPPSMLLDCRKQADRIITFFGVCCFRIHRTVTHSSNQQMFSLH